MSRPQTAALLRHLEPWLADRWDDSHSDHELLRRFAAQRDEAAFAALVRRHGPMVLGVCRRILHQTQDAEDAFQATFLVLFRKVGSPYWRDSIGGWLHRVATRIALRVCARRASPLPNRAAEEGIIADPLEQLSARELLAAFDEELARLAERHRVPLVLCYLEGKTQEEAARQLGWSLSTIRRRLDRGRKVLHQRLTRRGLELPAALGAVLLLREAPALVPAPLQAALSQALSGSAPARVAVLVQAALQALGMARFKGVGVLVVLVGMFAAGAGWTVCEVLARKREEPRAVAQAPMAEPGRPVPRDVYGDPLPPGVVARLGSRQLRHLRAHIAFTADGRTLISAGPDCRVCLWDLATGRLIRDRHVRRRTPHGFLYLENAALSANGDLLALNDPDGNKVHLYDTGTGEERGLIPMGGNMDVQLRFSPDGKTLALCLATSNKTLRLWDVSTGKERAILSHPSQLNSFAFSADSTRLASFCGDDRIHLWDARTGRELRSARGEWGSLAFSPDGKMLATCSSQAAVTLWETATLTKQGTLKASPGIVKYYHNRSLAFSPDGTLLAMGGDTASILWDVAARKERRRFPEMKANTMAFAPDGKTLACAGEAEVHLWDVASGKQLHQRPGHNGAVVAMAVSPDGKVLASTDQYRLLHLWDVTMGNTLRWPPTGRSHGLARLFSRDGKWLLSSGQSGVWLWDVTTGKEGRHFAIKDVSGATVKHEVWEVALSPDGRRLAALSDGENHLQQLSVWDAQTGEGIARRPSRGGLLPFSSVLCPDGAVVVVQTRERWASPEESADGTLTLEDTATGQRWLTIPRRLGYPLTFSPDGKLLAAGIHRSPEDKLGYQVKSLSVRETVTGEEVLRLEGALAPVVFSPDGRLLASIDAMGDGGVRIWDVATGQQLFRRRWPEDAVRQADSSPGKALAFFPDGKRVATGMEDGTILVWDLEPQTWPKRDLAPHLDDKQLEATWLDLAGDARRAHRAIYILAVAGNHTVSFLTDRLRPVATVDAWKVDRLVGELESDDFGVREAEVRQLTDMGLQIEPALRRVLENQPSPETQKRVRAILDRLPGVLPVMTLRTLRAERVLEAIATPEARQLLRKLAGGAAGARETRDAAAALARLERRSITPP